MTEIRHDESTDSAGELRARFADEVTPLTGPLHRHALRLTSNPTDAEDLLQETMMRGYRGFSTFRQGSNLSAWLFRIMTNAYINGYRKQQRRPVQRLTAEFTDLELAQSAGVRSAEEDVLEALPDGDVKAAMEALPEQFRLTLYYADVEGFRSHEIAAIMGSPIGTVVSRLHRGRLQLRRLLVHVARQRGYDVGDSNIDADLPLAQSA